MRSMRSPRLAASLTALAVATSALALISVPQASASSVGSQIASIASSQVGSGSTGPCGLAPGYAGYWGGGATSTQNSCASPGSNSGQSQAWCADFAAWVWNQAGVSLDKSINALANSFYTYSQEPGHSWSTSTPHVGDAVYFDSSLYGGHGHVGIVTSVNSDNSFSWVGGNQSGKVGTGSSKPGGFVWNYPSDGAAVYVMGFASPSGGAAPLPVLTATLSGISAGQTVSGKVNLNTAISPSGYVNYVDYEITGPINEGLRAGSGAYNYPATLDTSALLNGTYTITARAYETDNQFHNYATRSFTVNNSQGAPVPAPSGPGNTAAPSGPSLQHDGVTSVYTVGTNGHLYESWLTSYGANWAVQDMTNNYGTPLVMAGTKPTVAYHDGVASVYTVDVNGHLDETWLPKMGQNWSTQDMTNNYGTPLSSRTPAALTHPNASNGTATSVYTVDGNGHLDETWLPAMGQNWSTQDMTNNYGTPLVRSGSSPATLLHDGVASVYTVDGNGHLHESWLTSYGANWAVQDMTGNYGTPVSTGTPAALAHTNASGGTAASVYTVDGNGHLDETWLPAMGQNWSTQDMTNNYGTPTSTSSSAPIALLHDGVASVYTVDGNGHLDETWLPAYGQNWSTQDMTNNYGTPTTSSAYAAVIHTNASGGTAASVYTVDGSGHLDETWLPAMGQNWSTQDFNSNYGTPTMRQWGGTADELRQAASERRLAGSLPCRCRPGSRTEIRRVVCTTSWRLPPVSVTVSGVP